MTMSFVLAGRFNGFFLPAFFKNLKIIKMTGWHIVISANGLHVMYLLKSKPITGVYNLSLEKALDRIQQKENAGPNR